MTLEDLLARTNALVLDFDGPICAVFAGYPAAAVAAELHTIVADRLGGQTRWQVEASLVGPGRMRVEAAG